jgi:dihydropteroate synthase
MHMQGTPQTMQKEPAYDDVVAEVGAFFEDRLKKIAGAGVSLEQVALDPGLGFGKTVEHNFELLAAMKRFTRWKRPLVLGASRKSFLRPATGGTESSTRLPGSLACACWGVMNGIEIVRTHDVAATRQALQVTEAIMDRSYSWPTGSI